MGRFINADAFTSTGQGLLGNNVFAYCGNNPLNYCDPSGHYFSPTASHSKAIYYLSAGSRSTALHQLQKEAGNGTFNMSHSVPLLTEVTQGKNAIKTASLGEVSFDAFTYEHMSLDLLSAELTAISLDLTTNAYELSLFDLGKATAYVGVHDFAPSAGFMVSLWSPSISVNIGSIVVTASLHVGAIGAELSVTPSDFHFGFAKGVGASISIS